MKQYRVIVTLKAPFAEPVEMPYGPWTTDKFAALAALTTAFATHDPDDRWNACLGVRIDIIDIPDDAEEAKQD